MIITEELLRSFARYEIAFEDLHIDNTKSIRYEDYELTLEDLETVLDRILKEDIGWEKFCEEWLIPVWWDEETAGTLFLFPMIPERENSFYDGLPYSDGEVALRVFAELNRYIIFEGKDCGELRDTASYLKELLRCYRENQNRELIDWEYPDSIKKDFVMAVYRRELDHMQIDEERRELFKRYLDELIDHKDAYAMKVKGDLHYGGSSFYPCDWDICRDLLERSFELEQDPYTANSLGYIYYYGRCNNGIPEYDKAFKCFTFGYIHHLYESAYKLADMYKGGKGVPKSMETYASMIEDLYDYALKDFCEGEDKSFADVALRMGSVVEDFYEEPEDAYAYYLQADYAIKKRSKMGYYGDEKVAGYIREAIDRTRSFAEHIPGKDIEVDLFDMLDTVTDGMKYDGIARVRKLKSGYKLTLKKEEEYAPGMLLTMPEKDYCILTDKVDLYFESEKEIPEGKFSFDSYMMSEDDKEEVILVNSYQDVLRLPVKMTYKCR